MRLHACGETQSIRQFLTDDLLCVIAHHHMEFVRGGINVIEQTLRIKRSAGSSNGDEDFQIMISLRTQYGGIGDDKQVRVRLEKILSGHVSSVFLA